MPENFTVFSEHEKNRIRHHLGYPLADPVVSLSLGFPARQQTAFLLDAALNNIPESAASSIRSTLGTLEDLEQRQKEAVKRLKAKEVEGIVLNSDELNQLEGELARWSYNLAGDLGVPVNAYAPRFRTTAGVMPMNLPMATV